MAPGRGHILDPLNCVLVPCPQTGSIRELSSLHWPPFFSISERRLRAHLLYKMGCKNLERFIDPAGNRSAACLDGNKLSFKESFHRSHTMSSVPGTPGWLRNTGNLTQQALTSSPSSPPTSKTRSSRTMLVSDSLLPRAPGSAVPCPGHLILRAEKHLEAMLLVTRPPHSPLDTGEGVVDPAFWLCWRKGQRAFSLNWGVGYSVCS